MPVDNRTGRCKFVLFFVLYDLTQPREHIE